MSRIRWITILLALTCAGCGGGGGSSTSSPTNPQATPPGLSNISPTSFTHGTSTAVTLIGSGFVTGATTVNISTPIQVTNVSINSASSLTATFLAGTAAALGAQTVTVSNANGTSNAQAITIDPGGPQVFNYTAGPQTFTNNLPAAITALTITAAGAQGGAGGGAPTPFYAGGRHHCCDDSDNSRRCARR